jgi:hypothetical protein
VTHRGDRALQSINSTEKDNAMMRGALLWLVGIPLPIILLLWLFGFLS